MQRPLSPAEQSNPDASALDQCASIFGNMIVENSISLHDAIKPKFVSKWNIIRNARISTVVFNEILAFYVQLSSRYALRFMGDVGMEDYMMSVAWWVSQLAVETLNFPKRNAPFPQNTAEYFHLFEIARVNYAACECLIEATGTPNTVLSDKAFCPLLAKRILSVTEKKDSNISLSVITMSLADSKRSIELLETHAMILGKT